MKRSWPERWQNPGWWTLMGAPLSLVYWLLWTLAYRLHQFRRPHAVPGLKVLSVGNLSVGGTGKSALVKSLALASLKKKLRTAVLLRGYGAKAGARPLWVSRGQGALVSAPGSGDEAQEHARLKGLGVLIDSDRLRGAREAWRQGFEVLILDDGFQRRWQLQRSADIILASWTEIERGERLLPWGPWREPWDQVLGASALLLQDAPRSVNLPLPWKELPTLTVSYAPSKLWLWSHGKMLKGPALGAVKGKRVLALSGLGNPQRFENGLVALGAKVTAARFSDHHPFSPIELQALSFQGRDVVLTTVKDAMRLPSTWRCPLPVWVLEAELVSSKPKDLQGLFQRVLR